MSHRECAKATVKVTLTGPDGKVLKVVEEENPDPFGYSFINVLLTGIGGLSPSITIRDAFNNTYTFDFYTSSPSTSLGYLIPGFCFTNCPNASSTPPNGPGILLYGAAPDVALTNGWAIYEGFVFPFYALITGLSYSPLIINTGSSSPSSPGDIVYGFINATQSITNSLSTPVEVRTITLAGAVYGSLSASPVYMPITFYVLSSPIVLSPGVTMTVSVTISFPYGIAASSTSESSSTVV